MMITAAIAAAAFHAAYFIFFALMPL